MGIQLSKRMDKLASMVSDGYRLADIGTDHGYIPIALVQTGRIPSAIAMDVNKGPLERAALHMQEQGVGTYVETRLSDGLTLLKEGEADTVLIAGMGGALTVHILEGGSHCLASVKELILQPQSEIWLVRNWLQEHGWQITAEDMVFEEGKYYPMMRAVHGTMAVLSQAEQEYGRSMLQRSPDAWQAYLRAEQEKLEHIRKILEENGQQESPRYEELTAKADRIAVLQGKGAMG